MQPRRSVLAVVVAYRKAWRELASADFLSAATAANRRPADPANLVMDQLLVYDNSPAPQAAPPTNLRNVTYHHDAQNGGTRAAYVLALELALQGDHEWMLLLDHDTALPSDYFLQASKHLAPDVDVLMPLVMQRGRIVSPSVLTRLGRISTRRAIRAGTEPRRPTAIASGLLVRTSALAAIFPPPAALWLDYLDHWMFVRFREKGIRARAIDVVLQHDLSLVDVGSMSTERLLSVWRGERIFMSMLSPPARAFYRLRLAFRMLRLRLVHPAAAAALASWIVHSRHTE